MQNDPAWLDKEAREDLQREEVNMLTGGEVDSEQVNVIWVTDNKVKNLQQMFENINANDQIIKANRVDNILAAIASHSTIDPQMLGAGNEPRDWDDTQRRSLSEAAEWKTAFEDKAKSLKDMGIYILIPHSEVPKIHHCKAFLRNKLNKNGNLA